MLRSFKHNSNTDFQNQGKPEIAAPAIIEILCKVYNRQQFQPSKLYKFVVDYDFSKYAKVNRKTIQCIYKLFNINYE